MSCQKSSTNFSVSRLVLAMAMFTCLVTIANVVPSVKAAPVPAFAVDHGPNWRNRWQQQIDKVHNAQEKQQIQEAVNDKLVPWNLSAKIVYGKDGKSIGRFGQKLASGEVRPGEDVYLRFGNKLKQYVA